MSDAHNPILTPSDILSGPPEWPKDPRSWEHVVGNSEVIYEDSHVIVFHDPEDEDNESARGSTEVRATLISKRHMHSLMDLGVADEQLGAQILHGIQQAAFRLGLQDKGFEVRVHVYPPMQLPPNSPSKYAPANRRTKPTPPTRRRSRYTFGPASRSASLPSACITTIATTVISTA